MLATVSRALCSSPSRRLSISACALSRSRTSAARTLSLLLATPAWAASIKAARAEDCASRSDRLRSIIWRAPAAVASIRLAAMSAMPDTSSVVARVASCNWLNWLVRLLVAASVRARASSDISVSACSRASSVSMRSPSAWPLSMIWAAMRALRSSSAGIDATSASMRAIRAAPARSAASARSAVTCARLAISSADASILLLAAAP